MTTNKEIGTTDKFILDLPNYTQVPNKFIDNMATLSSSAIVVYVAICRKTIGWHKTVDKVSYSQLGELTGLAVNTLKKGIKELKLCGLIEQSRSKHGYIYDLVLSVGGQQFVENNSKKVKQPTKVAVPDVKSLVMAKARQWFSEYYEQKFGVRFITDGKEQKGLLLLLGKLITSYKQKNNIIPDEDSLFSAFKYFIGNVDDAWIWEHFSFTLLNSKYNNIVTSIINKRANGGTSAVTTKRKFGGGYKESGVLDKLIGS